MSPTGENCVKFPLNAPVSDPGRAPLLLAGYYGHGNAGDELILQLLHGAAGKGEFLSGGHPQRDGAVPKFKGWALWRALGRCRGLLLGGGELFQARTSIRSMVYYLLLPLLARLAGKPTLTLGLGLDPDLSPFFQRMTAFVLRKAFPRGVRDEGSRRMLSRYGVSSTVAPDLAWAWDRSPAAPATGLRRVLWIPRFPHGMEDVDRLAKILNSLGSSHPWAQGLLAFHPEGDGQNLGRLRARLNFFHRLETWKTLDDLWDRLKAYDVIVSMRFHGVLLGVLAGRAVLALAEHGKVRDLARDLAVPCLSLNEWRVTEGGTLLASVFAQGPVSPGSRPAHARAVLSSLGSWPGLV